MIWGVIASIALVFICVLYYICYSRRKEEERRRVVINKKKGSQKAVEINVRCSSKGNTTETQNEQFQQTESARVSNTTDEILAPSRKERGGKTSKPITPRSSNDEDDHDVDPDQYWDSYNQTFHKRTRAASKTTAAIIESSTNQDMSSRSLNIKENRRRLETWNETEKVRRQSSLNFGSTTSGSDNSGKEKRRSSKMSKKKRSKRLETKVARTDLLAETKGASTDGGRMQITVIPSLKEVIDNLEEERMKLESRHKQVLEEKMRLQADINYSKKHIEELTYEDERNEVELYTIEVNKELVRSGSAKCLAESESQQILLRSELTGLLTEKEEMEQLLASLKFRKQELAQQLDDEQRQTRQSHADLMTSLDGVYGKADYHSYR